MSPLTTEIEQVLLTLSTELDLGLVVEFLLELFLNSELVPQVVRKVELTNM
jgi:hypothetical protein